MCLEVSQIKSKQLYHHWIEQGLESVQAWKVVRMFPDQIMSLYYPHTWEVGINKSDLGEYEDTGAPDSDPALIIKNGIHVYRTKQDAERDMGLQRINWNQKVALMEVECPVDQFMSCSFFGELAAFKQVVLTQEEYGRLIKPEYKETSK